MNKNILIVSLVALVNMLGYGIIIPILYGYSKQFGLTDFQNGLLFASFSVCQFLSTPIIGRMSDKYGRRPLLLISILGTAVSFVLMALARNPWWLFAARVLDGITAGNIPVAMAVISDSTEPLERPRAFGKIGAAFNFGFVFGPAIAAFTVGFGQAVPFVIAAIVTTLAALLMWVYLPETNKHMGEVKKGKLFDLPLLWKTLWEPNVGTTFLISMLYMLAFSCAIIYGFQPFTANVLKLDASQNAILFTLFGVVGLVTQTYLVGWVTKRFGMKKAFTWSMAFTAVSFIIMFVSKNIAVFSVATVILALVNSIGQTLIPAVLSMEADAKSQGSMLGLNASYQSLGMIFGPILGGVVASLFVTLPFVVGAILMMGCFYLSFRTMRVGVHKESAF